MKRIIAVLLVLAMLPLFSACRDKKGSDAGEKRLKVITTLFPLYDFSREIAGDKAEVTMLLPPGMEPHGFEPKPEDIFRVSKADIFIYTDRYMEPWAADLAKGIGNPSLLVIDSGNGVKFMAAGETDEHDGHGHDHGKGMDPHIWLDFANAQKMVNNIAAGMAAKDPGNGKYYLERAAAYNMKLAALDERFREGLSGCSTRMFLHGGHYAFGYMAARYGLDYRSAYSVSANAEPTPQKIAELVSLIKGNGLKYVFYEELFSPTMADAMARECGAKLLQLNVADSVTRGEFEKGVSFISLMEKNLENLRKGLKCR